MPAALATPHGTCQHPSTVIGGPPQALPGNPLQPTGHPCTHQHSTVSDSEGSKDCGAGASETSQDPEQPRKRRQCNGQSDASREDRPTFRAAAREVAAERRRARAARWGTRDVPALDDRQEASLDDDSLSRNAKRPCRDHQLAPATAQVATAMEALPLLGKSQQQQSLQSHPKQAPQGDHADPEPACRGAASSSAGLARMPHEQGSLADSSQQGPCLATGSIMLPNRPAAGMHVGDKSGQQLEGFVQVYRGRYKQLGRKSLRNLWNWEWTPEAWAPATSRQLRCEKELRDHLAEHEHLRPTAAPSGQDAGASADPAGHKGVLLRHSGAVHPMTDVQRPTDISTDNR